MVEGVGCLTSAATGYCSEHDTYVVVTGSILMALGVIGLILNSSTLPFFFKFRSRQDAQSQEAHNQLSQHIKRVKTAAVNMTLIDLLLSAGAACVRGPGFIRPTAIYGSATPRGTTRCITLSVIFSWFLSDLNMLAIIPISFVSVFGVRKGQLRLLIALCWLLPVLECVLLLVGIEKGYLDSHYKDEFRKCSLHRVEDSTVDWERVVDYTNMALFHVLPLLTHTTVWVLFCCRRSGLPFKQRLSGFLVVFIALISWFPYGVRYGYMRHLPTGKWSLVYIGFYISIVTNPLLYGFCIYSCRVY